MSIYKRIELYRSNRQEKYIRLAFLNGIVSLPSTDQSLGGQVADRGEGWCSYNNTPIMSRIRAMAPTEHELEVLLPQPLAPRLIIAAADYSLVRWRTTSSSWRFSAIRRVCTPACRTCEAWMSIIPRHGLQTDFVASVAFCSPRGRAKSTQWRAQPKRASKTMGSGSSTGITMHSRLSSYQLSLARCSSLVT